MILESDFLQGMESVRLSAERFMTFNLQDIYYLVEVTKMLAEMKGKPQMPPDLKTFFEKEYNSYQSYADAVLKKYGLTVSLSGLGRCLMLETFKPVV